MIEFSITNNKRSYKIEIQDKYTMIRGLSGIGKTTLYKDVMNACSKRGPGKISGYSKIHAVSKLDTYDNIKSLREYVIFMDENCDLIHTENLGTLLQESCNYFVFITRDISIPVPVYTRSVFTLQSKGGSYWLEPEYNVSSLSQARKYQNVITESTMKVLKERQSLAEKGKMLLDGL